MIEKDGDFYLVQNSLPFILEETAKLHSLGSAEVNYHLIDVTYKEKAIYIAYHHGLCDGCGIMPFVKTLMYYYCTYKYNRKLNVSDVRLVGEPLLHNEITEPLKDGSIDVDETKLPKIHKDGFSLPDSINSVGKKIKLGDCEQYIDSFHTYTSGTTGLSMQMLSFGEYITINFMQSFETDKYINAFAHAMEEAGLEFSISDIIEYTTPKDSIYISQKECKVSFA